jgi:hypothetical protein
VADNLHLMFLVGECFEEGQAIRGASLVTDGKTRPIEFRCTSPIRPNDYQRTLYGETLDEYVFVDLIGVPLITSTQEQLDLVLVEDPRFLGARPSVDLPVVQISRPSGNSDAAALVFRAHRRYGEEEQRVPGQLQALLEDGRDLLEPFQRVRTALAQAHAQKIGDKGG